MAKRFQPILFSLLISGRIITSPKTLHNHIFFNQADGEKFDRPLGLPYVGYITVYLVHDFGKKLYMRMLRASGIYPLLRLVRDGNSLCTNCVHIMSDMRIHELVGIHSPWVARGLSNLPAG